MLREQWSCCVEELEPEPRLKAAYAAQVESNSGASPAMYVSIGSREIMFPTTNYNHTHEATL
jgi:hypothetical protein